MDQDKNNDPYEIGYGKPPREGCFRKGESGNPKGRPKKKEFDALLASALDAALNDYVQVGAGSETLTLTRRHLAIRRVVEDAAKGNRRSITRLIKLREFSDREPSMNPMVIEMDMENLSPVGEEHIPAMLAEMEANRKALEGANRTKVVGLRELIDQELFRKVPVTIARKPQRLTMLEVIVMQLSNAAIQGDTNAFTLLMKMKKVGKKSDKPGIFLVLAPAKAA